MCIAVFPQVSRSFAAVIRQLPKILATDIVVFYLVLRGLDTVEDDMTAFDDVQVCCSYTRGVRSVRPSLAKRVGCDNNVMMSKLLRQRHVCRLALEMLWWR